MLVNASMRPLVAGALGDITDVISKALGDSFPDVKKVREETVCVRRCVCVCVTSKALGDSFPDVKKVIEETGCV